jgi:hypothetical protein
LTHEQYLSEPARLIDRFHQFAKLEASVNGG